MSKSWYKRTLKQEVFVTASDTFVRSIGHRDQLLGVQRFEDGQESDIYPPYHQDYSSGSMQWFFRNV